MNAFLPNSYQTFFRFFKDFKHQQRQLVLQCLLLRRIPDINL